MVLISFRPILPITFPTSDTLVHSHYADSFPNSDIGHTATHRNRAGRERCLLSLGKKNVPNHRLTYSPHRHSTLDYIGHSPNQTADKGSVLSYPAFLLLVSCIQLYIDKTNYTNIIINNNNVINQKHSISSMYVCTTAYIYYLSNRCYIISVQFRIHVTWPQVSKDTSFLRNEIHSPQILSVTIY